MKNLRVPLILLAAGESRRMGTPKQLLPYKETNLIRHAVTEVVTSYCNPVIVVLGANSDATPRYAERYPLGRRKAQGKRKAKPSQSAKQTMGLLPRHQDSDRISSEISDLPVHITYNTQWQQGMSTSIATGIKALLEMKVNFDAVIVALADQPLITSQVYNRSIERYYLNHPLAVASNYNDTIGVPALFDRTLIPELLKMKQKGGAKQLLNKYSDRAFNLDVPEAAVDIDTPADYQKLLKT